MVVQETVPPSEGSRASGKHEKKHRLKQRFEVVKKLGQGTYGKVQLAINKETSQEVAIKTIKKSKIESEQDLIRIRREIQIMSSIQHPHIIHIYEVFENKDKIVLVMQYASGGELYDYLSEKKILNDTEARQIFRQVAAAVYYCHKNKICHRDLKLENVLLDEKGNAKIADFGLSNVYDEKHLLDTFCGSPLYASPEIVKGVPYYGPEVDCWSMGVILYTLVYGAMPFDGSNFKRLVKQISEGDYYEPAKKAEASPLIHRLLHVNPAKRATIIDICTDSWVNEGYEHSLLQVSEDLANLTPVRIDLLLALAPASPAANEEKDIQHPLAGDHGNKSCDKLPEEHDDDTETATDSFAYLDGGTESHRSASFPNLPNLDDTMDGDEEFLPAAVAAELEGQYAKRQAERSFDSGLVKASSIVHKTKKPRKSSSEDNTQPTENTEGTIKTENIPPEAEKDQNNNGNVAKNDTETAQLHTKKEDISAKEKDKGESKLTESDNSDNKKSLETNKQTAKRRQSAELNKTDKEKISAPGGRVPGKVTIPKFLESPEPSPTKTPEKKFPSSQAPDTNNAQSEPKVEKDVKNIKSDTVTTKPNSTSVEKEEKQPEKDTNIPENNTEKEEKNKSGTDSSENKDINSEDKKCAAKGILKKNIAKARLLEKRLSQQSSVESETGPASPPSGQTQVSPTLSNESPDVSKGPSFFKVPQPYSKDIKDKPVESKAEIVFTSNQEQEKSLVSLSSQSSREETESIWGTPLSPPVRDDVNSKIIPKHVGWNNALPNLKSGTDDWKQQVQDSLLRLSPQEEDDFPSGKQLGPTPISRSYKKFTFTKEGTCITETGKIYTKPGADGSWTKVEKKTKITTLPGSDEFQKFEHVQVRDESNLSRSDSQSSSGSNDIFDDIFDSWTGDSMMCNFMKVKDNIRRFSRGPLLWRDRQRDPFKQFYNAQTSAREAIKHSERLSNPSSEWESSDNEDFEDMQPVVYGSQGLWQLMKSVNKDLPHHLRSFRDSPRLGNYTRSISRDRGTVSGKQSQYATRASSGYSTRSLSRERSQSPKETVLRFVIESPQRQQSINNSATESPSPSVQELWHSKCTPSAAERRCRKDSGVESCASSDSEATRQVPSRMSSRDEETGYTSFDGTFGPRTYRQYIKSFSKPSSESQRSLEEPQTPFDNLADSRRHRVEQWLHMADVDGFDSPFEEIARHHDLLAQYETPGSTIYGTMRPRGFMKYSRSMSDKMNDPDGHSTTSVENQARNDQSLEEQTKSYRSEINVENMGKVQSSMYKTANYSTDRISSHPVSGSSYRLQQCDSAEITAKNQTASNQSNSPNNVRYTRSYSGNLQYAGPQDKGQNRPILSMTVSFNRGGAEGPVVVQSNTPRPSGFTGGIWQQQEFSSSPGKVTIRREFSDPSSEPTRANVSHRIYTVGGENVSSYNFQETERCPTGNFGQPRADGSIPIRVYTTKTTRLN